MENIWGHTDPPVSFLGDNEKAQDSKMTEEWRQLLMEPANPQVVVGLRLRWATGPPLALKRWVHDRLGFSKQCGQTNHLAVSEL